MRTKGSAEKDRFSCVFKKAFIIVVALIALVELLRVNGYHAIREPGYYVGGNELLQYGSIPANDCTTSFFPKEKRVEGIRICMSTVPAADETGTIPGRLLLEIYNNKGMIFSGSNNFSSIEPNTWVVFKTGLTLNTDQEYTIRLTAVDTNQLPEIYVSADRSSPAVSVIYAPELEPVDKILYSILILFAAGGCLEAVFYVPRLAPVGKRLIERRDPVTLYGVLAAAFSCFSVKMLGLAHDLSVIVVFFVLSFWCANWMSNHFEEVCTYYDSKGKRIGIVVLSLWTAFGLVGSKYFVYPFEVRSSIWPYVTYALTVFWVLPVIVKAVMTIDSISEKSEKRKEKTLPVSTFWLCVGIFAVAALIYIRAFNPAISSPDTLICMYYGVFPIQGSLDWYPPAYMLALKGLLGIVPSIYAVVGAQYLFFAYVYFQGAALLYRRGVSSGWIVILTILTVMNTANMVLLTTIWKDIPYTTCLLWLTVLGARLILENRKNQIGLYIQLVLALVGTYFFRSNGIVPYILMSVCLVLTFWKNKKILCPVGIALALILLIKYPLYDYYEIERIAGAHAYVGLEQDIISVYYGGGDVPEDAMELITADTESDIIQYKATPYSSSAAMIRPTSIGDFIKMYIHTFINEPWLTMKAVLCRQDMLWNVFPGEDAEINCYNYTETMDGKSMEYASKNLIWNDLWPEREDNIFTTKLTAWTTAFTQDPLLNAITWRYGLSLIFTLLSFTVMVMKGIWKKYYLLFVPYVGQAISLILSTPWPDTRYWWALGIMAAFILPLTFTMKREMNVSVSEK